MGEVSNFSHGRQRDFFSSISVQTSSETHPVSYPIRTVDVSEIKALLGRETDHSPPSSVEVQNE
jgi:hypothetical protein